MAQIAGVDITTDAPLKETINYISNLVDELEVLTYQIEEIHKKLKKNIKPHLKLWHKIQVGLSYRYTIGFDNLIKSFKMLAC